MEVLARSQLPQPYWEAYPINGEAERFLLNESRELIDAIVAELSKPACRPAEGEGEVTCYVSKRGKGRAFRDSDGQVF